MALGLLWSGGEEREDKGCGCSQVSQMCSFIENTSDRQSLDRGLHFSLQYQYNFSSTVSTHQTPRGVFGRKKIFHVEGRLAVPLKSDNEINHTKIFAPPPAY